MSKKLKQIVTGAVLSVFMTSIAPILSVSAEVLNSSNTSISNSADTSSLTSADNLIGIALESKTFYDFNMAYTEVMKINDENTRNERLNQLAELAGYVFTPTILDYVNKLAEIADKASGKLYDSMYVDLENEDRLIEVDRSYLFTELASWGRKRVWTEDYSAGVAEVIKGWESLIAKEAPEVLAEKIANARETANKIANEYSRTYLLEEIDKIDLGRQAIVLNNASKAVEAELEKLPADKEAADLLSEKDELEALLAGVSAKVEEAKAVGLTDEDIEALENFGRIAITTTRISDIEVNEFTTIHAAVLALTADTVTLTDKDSIEAALTSYGGLKDAIKEKLITEKALLDSLLAKINDVGQVPSVDEFKTENARILALTVDTVATTDKNDVEAALAAYEDLSDTAKEDLIVEGTLLDSLANEIADLELTAEEESFTIDNATVLALTVDTVAITDKVDVEAALAAYDSLSDAAKEDLFAEKTLLDSLLDQIITLELELQG